MALTNAAWNFRAVGVVCAPSIVCIVYTDCCVSQSFALCAYHLAPLDHSDLESMYHQYVQCRFQWVFTYWLFRQPPPLNRQVKAIYLQWTKHSTKKVSTWGETVCDVRYLASLHHITSDYWKGKLARGDENIGKSEFKICDSAWVMIMCALLFMA